MLNPIGTEIWSQDGAIALPGGLSMPGRATVMRLTSGALVLHSPLPIDDETARSIDALGDVRFVVAPNLRHWLFLEAAAKRYPAARVLGPSGLEKKVALRIEPLPDDGQVEGMEGVLVQRIEGAPSMEEHVFLHQPSSSLVVADLMFNVHDCPSFGMRGVLRLAGAYRKTAQSRAWRFLVKDRAAAARAAGHVLSWDFARVIVAHGDIVEAGARDRAREALGWMTGGAPALRPAGSPAA